MAATSHNRRALIIGAGVAGLAAVKNCLEVGIEPICYEQHDDIGGIWNYSPEIRPYQGAASFKNLITNVSKDTNCFTDFPCPKDYPEFMTHDQFKAYLQLYIEHFNLLKYITFKKRVVRVWPVEDFKTTGRWNVLIKVCDNDVEQEQMVFDCVFVCSGQLVSPQEPRIQQRERYKGEIMHMWHYRTPDVFSGKRVLVIGNQHSAGDAVADAATCAKQVFLSPGRGGLRLMNRLSWDGTSHELKGINRLISYLVPTETIGKFFISVSRKYFDPTQYGIADGGNPFTEGAIMINDEVRYKISNGTIKPVSPVVSYNENGVETADGQKIEVDLILLATGYTANYDFIDVPSIKGKSFQINCDNALHLYKWVFPPEVQPCTIMLGNAINVMGPHTGTLDMRARWAAHVFAGEGNLPEQKAMIKHARRERELEMRSFGSKVRLMWYRYCDSIAEEIGCSLSFWRIFLRSPFLAFKVYLGPILPSHYRLCGTRAISEAAQTSHAVYDQIYPHTNTRIRTVLAGLSLAIAITLKLICL